MTRAKAKRRNDDERKRLTRHDSLGFKSTPEALFRSASDESSRRHRRESRFIRAVEGLGSARLPTRASVHATSA